MAELVKLSHQIITNSIFILSCLDSFIWDTCLNKLVSQYVIIFCFPFFGLENS